MGISEGGALERALYDGGLPIGARAAESSLSFFLMIAALLVTHSEVAVLCMWAA